MATTKSGKSDHYDMVVIGGGVYGTAVLWEATHRGLRVLLLEKNDFCSGTSANSLKTIHGGIRYLQSANLKRTIDSDREKVILKKIAENIVEPLTCTLAATNLTTKSYLSFFVATKLFNFLSTFSALGSGRFKEIFTPSSAKRKFTILNKVEDSSSVLAGQSCMVWQDAQVTNSEHLPLAFIRSAQDLGSAAWNYAEVSKVEEKGTQYEVTYSTAPGTSARCSSDTIVDCSAGPSFLRSADDSTDYVCGLNVVMNQQFSDYAYALGVNSSKGGKQGLLFFSPWKDYTIAGTWYYKKSELLTRDNVDEAVISTCLSDMAAAFAEAGFSVGMNELASMVEDIHLGFLPADASIADAEKSIIERAIVEKRSTNYFELRGNKYTTARLNAQRLVDMIALNNAKIQESESHRLPLNGLSRASQTTANLFDGSLVWIEMLARYGELAEGFSNLLNADPDGFELVPGSAQIYKVEVEYFANLEHTQRLTDLLYRRLNINVHKPISEQTIEWCAQRMSAFKQWAQAELESNIGEALSREQGKTRLKAMLITTSDKHD